MKIRHQSSPRLSVFRSSQHFYAQVFDSLGATVIASASTVEKDIDEIEIVRSEDHKKIIPVTDTISLSMKYPSIDFIKVLRQGEDAEDQAGAMFDLMRDCIDTVVEGEDVYKIADFTTQEVTDFIDTLDGNVLNHIKEFFDTIPKMRFETKYKLEDGTEKTFVAEGTETFFI